MTYGQTSSGKTHTLFGDKQKPGIIPLFLKDAFSKLKDVESFEDCSYKFKYSFFEIYNEKINDLLVDKGGHNLNLRENFKKNLIFVENLKQKKASSYEQVIEDLNKSNEKRKINETSMNQRSSRSHFIINFVVETKYMMDYDDTKLLSKQEKESLFEKNFYQVKKKS